MTLLGTIATVMGLMVASALAGWFARGIWREIQLHRLTRCVMCNGVGYYRGHWGPGAAEVLKTSQSQGGP